MTFFIDGDKVINVSTIEHVDLHCIEQLILRVYPVKGLSFVVSGHRAIELLMLIKPSALEGKRLKWIRHAWMLHNFVGHPLMQILTFCNLPNLAMAIHEATVPKPRGHK